MKQLARFVAVVGSVLAVLIGYSYLFFEYAQRNFTHTDIVSNVLFAVVEGVVAIIVSLMLIFGLIRLWGECGK